MKNSVTPEEFILAWQTSETLEEVKAKTGMPGANCHTRANYYRRQGVTLKNLVSQPKVNWMALADLAAQSLKEQTA
jgi:hypothetical protein